MKPERSTETPDVEENARTAAEPPAAARRPMTLAEAGRRGGEKVKRERGAEFYAEIGRKGGRRVAESHGPSFYAEIGRKGGESRRGHGDDDKGDTDATAARPVD